MEGLLTGQFDGWKVTGAMRIFSVLLSKATWLDCPKVDHNVIGKKPFTDCAEKVTGGLPHSLEP
ncbi:MAG TPA: hypothetical protein ENJ82_06160 [Bacteroidetes bacterium]|nr:hypothetical protein [Bacteroidota bacterium]